MKPPSPHASLASLLKTCVWSFCALMLPTAASRLWVALWLAACCPPSSPSSSSPPPKVCKPSLPLLCKVCMPCCTAHLKALQTNWSKLCWPGLLVFGAWEAELDNSASGRLLSPCRCSGRSPCRRCVPAGHCSARRRPNRRGCPYHCIPGRGRPCRRWWHWWCRRCGPNWTGDNSVLSLDCKQLQDTKVCCYC